MRSLYPLTNPQQSIWLTEQFGANTNLNNIGGYVCIHEPVVLGALEKAIHIFIQSNEAMRIHIQLTDDNIPMQYISNADDTVCSIKKTLLPHKEALEAWNKALIDTPFSTIDSNLYRFEIFFLPNGLGGFHISLHHLITDAWGMSLAISQIMDNYTRVLNLEKVEYTTPNYTDFIASEEKYLSSSKYLKDEEFWNDQFSTSPELCLVSSKKTNVIDTTAKREAFTLDENLYYQIDAFCKNYHISVYTFFLAIYSIYLAKLNNTNTSIIGTPILNRTDFAQKHTARYVY